MTGPAVPAADGAGDAYRSVEPDARDRIACDRIATDLLRTAVLRDGTLRTRRTLAVCLRGALLADLALHGTIADTGLGPVPTGAPPPADPILTAVHNTVMARPGVAWRRWYRHVDVDLAALADELVGAGRWTTTRAGIGRRAVEDPDAGGALALGLRVRAIGLGQEEPESPREAVLGALAVACGGGHGAPEPRAVVPLSKVLTRFGDVEGERLQAAHAAVGTANVMVRKARRRLG